MQQLISPVLKKLCGKSLASADSSEIYRALLSLVKSRISYEKEQKPDRRLYYLSAEFLIGKLLSNNLINLGIYEDVDRELRAAGLSLAEIEDREPEPSLGNGGLGRLAACFLDSIATLGLPGEGVGLLYHDGLFRQKFTDLKQAEFPDPWIGEDGWLAKTDICFDIPFADFTLRSRLYELPVTGYGGRNTKLRLFDCETTDPAIIQDGIDFDKKDIAKNITLFLYPDDSDHAGRMLRIYQQYFMVSSAAQLILQEMKESGFPPEEMSRHVVIQINDTHPSLIIPELIRLLRRRHIPTEKAVKIVSECCAYTNHTILAEALEKWPLADLEEVVPHLVPIIKTLDRMAKKAHPDPKVAIIDSDKLVHMAHMDIHFGFSINGVASLHTGILKNTELKPFYDIYPEKFNNKTNGITFRRWLMACNPALAAFITEHIGEGWKKDAMELRKLLAFREDEKALRELDSIKQANKKALADYILKTQGETVSPDSVFDIQIKRMHQYKRQQMNALYIIWKYKEIKAGRIPPRPITFFFGAKAAPAYTLAKDTIHLILCLKALIGSDPDVSPWIRIVMVENYNVTKAEKLIPACDISEQISLASKEASGTGNMKLMLSGAVTLGTLDGANVEISELAGKENVRIFGRKSEDVIRLYADQGYKSYDFYKDPEIEPLVDFIISKEMITIGDPENLCRVFKDFVSKDWFMTLLDLKEYIAVKEALLLDYENRAEWSRMSLCNIAGAGYFSSDRTIAEYNRDIWHLPESR